MKKRRIMFKYLYAMFILIITCVMGFGDDYPGGFIKYFMKESKGYTNQPIISTNDYYEESTGYYLANSNFAAELIYRKDISDDSGRYEYWHEEIDSYGDLWFHSFTIESNRHQSDIEEYWLIDIQTYRWEVTINHNTTGIRKEYSEYHSLYTNTIYWEYDYSVTYLNDTITSNIRWLIEIATTNTEATTNYVFSPDSTNLTVEYIEYDPETQFRSETYFSSVIDEYGYTEDEYTQVYNKNNQLVDY